MKHLRPLLLAAPLLWLTACQEGAHDEGVPEIIPPDRVTAQGLDAPPSDDPGTVTDHAQVGYDDLVESLEAGTYPEALFFRGTLPCASCPGIRTKLTLIPDTRIYVLRETYLEADGGRDATFTTVGSWAEEPGVLEARPEAPVFRLETTAGNPPRAYLARLAVDTLRLLDREGRWIDSELPYELVRVED
jgi:hypothetical protein